MRISYNWLKEYIDLKMPAKECANILTMAGLAVDSVESVPGDTILLTEITANRPDWLSYIGVARELSALTGAKLKIPLVGRLNRQTGKQDNRITVTVGDKRLCPRYTARVIRDVKVGDSPAWLRTKIEAMGLRSVNNAVDITNFCLFETGEPMHAFDLDKIKGGKITVRRAMKGEKLTAIDGSERTLENSDLVIADEARPIAIAGVMGGLDTEVTSSTKNILLEAAYFDPISVRRTSKRLALSTESSYRFERKVDIANIPYCSDRASSLIVATGGKPEEFMDSFTKARGDEKAITLRYEKLNSVLGVKIAPARARKILFALGLKAKSSSKDKITFCTPVFRYDLNAEIDLIEEVSRVYGYDRIPKTIPAIAEQPRSLPYDIKVASIVRQTLSGIGMDEIITYSLTSKDMANAAGEDCGNRIIEVLNPLTIEEEIMRPGLLPGLLNAILWNLNRKAQELKLFEIGKAYLKSSEGKFTEERHISLGITGEVSDWLGGARPVGFFDLKGIVEAVFARLGIEKPVFRHAKDKRFSTAACSVIEVSGQRVGIIGAADRSLLNNFDIKSAVYFGEISLDAMLPRVNLKKSFAECAKYPSARRDISIIVEKKATHTDIVNLMFQAASPTLKSVVLIDRYEGKQIPEGKIGLTYRLEYRDVTKTLEEKDVSALHAKILTALDEKLGAKLR